MIRSFLVCRFFTNIKKPSYDIEKEYSVYKLKRKFEFDKSFKTFSLTPPKQISSKVQQPKILLSDISNIKEYSHTHPEFLLKQIQNPQSKIAQSLSAILNRLYLMKPEDGLEFVLFLDKWGSLSEQEREMVRRWTTNQDFNFQQLWLLLKSNLGLQGELQNRIIKYLGIIQPKQYSYLFKALNYYRLKNIGSEEFFIFVSTHIIRNIELMTGSQLVQLVSHYANNINENMETKLNILESVSNRMGIILQHLSATQLLNVLFCYLKLDMFKQEIGDKVIQKIVQTLPQWKAEEIRQLMEVSTNLGRKQQLIIKELVKMFYNNKIPHHLFPSLYCLAIQYSVLEKQFIRRIEEKLLESVHNMTPENVSKACWALAVVPRQQYFTKSAESNLLIDKLFYRKVEEIVEGGLRDYTIKDVTRIVWSLGTKQFKLDAPFWNNIEHWLQEQLYTESTTLRDVSLILWAYTNRVPLKANTVQIMKRIIFQKIEDSEGFDLAMICWYFSQITQSNPEILKAAYSQFQDQIESMEFLQVLKCLRWFIQERVVDNSTLTKFVERVNGQYKEKSYFVLLNTLAMLTSIKIEDKQLLIDTVLKVDEHIKTLKQIQSSAS